MRRLLVAGALLALIALAPAAHVRAATPDVAPPDPFVLALDASAFPAGAMVSRAHVDTTAATVDAERMLGDNSANGDLYQRALFWGSVVESATLPRLSGASRTLWLMATVFRSTSAAQRAFALDGHRPSCIAAPHVALPMPAVTCAYVSASNPETGMYVVAAVGSVEFIVHGYVNAVGDAAFYRAVRDTSYLAQQEAGHLKHVLALGQFDPARAPAPVVLTGTSHVLCQFSSIATTFPGWSAQEQPVILQTRRDLNAHSVVGNAGEVFPRDGFQRGCVELFDLPSIAGAHHGLSVETDVFATTAGAQQAYRWWNGVEAWDNPPTHILRVNAFGAPSLALSYVDRTFYHNTSALVFTRHANVLVALRSWTDGTSSGVAAQTTADLFRAARLVASTLAQEQS